VAGGVPPPVRIVAIKITAMMPPPAIKAGPTFLVVEEAVPPGAAWGCAASPCGSPGWCT
jgi:hypothetical protein